MKYIRYRIRGGRRIHGPGRGSAFRRAATPLLALLFAPAVLNADMVSSESHDFRVVQVAGRLEHPWAIAFLPGEGMLITERAGRLNHLHNGVLTRIRDVPGVAAVGQGGMLDVVLHPDFANTKWIYLSHSSSYRGGIGTTVTRARLDLDNHRIEDLELIYRMPNPPGGGQHFGSRLAFDPDGYLFITIGDRGQRVMAQRLDRAHGKLLRLHDDGSIPDDNPFAGTPLALPEIYSYGHRNGQGLYIEPESGIIWKHEHGPMGGDTLMLVKAGANYGWPVATYGTEYATGIPIGDLPHLMPDIENPITWWGPTSIAPSGMTRYTGNAFPRWHGDLFIGSLVQQHIRRVVLDGDRVVHEEELLRESHGRIRDVATGPDGLLYFATDAPYGAIYRIEPPGSWWTGLPGEGGWRDSTVMPELNLGWVNDVHWPWVYSLFLEEGVWLWITGDRPDSSGFHAFAVAGDWAGWLFIFPLARAYFDYTAGEWRGF